MIDVLMQTGAAAGYDIPMRLAVVADTPEFIGSKCKVDVELPRPVCLISPHQFLHQLSPFRALTTTYESPVDWK